MSKQKTSDKKIDLSPSLTRPLDRSALSNDNATLRALTGMLNNPALTGAEAPPPEEKFSAPAAPSGATLVVDSTPTPDVLQAAQAMQAIAAAPQPTGTTAPVPKTRNTLIMLTGRNTDRVTAATGNVVFNIYAPVETLARSLLSSFDAAHPGADTFLANIRAWGAGEVSDDFPITAERIIFVKMIRSIAATLGSSLDWGNFGSDAGFWVDACHRAALSFHDESPGTPVFITGIADKYEFDYFRAHGFTHWHVTGRPAPGLSEDKFSTSLDNDVVRQVSNNRNGPKLRAIWCESVPCNSNRLWTIPEFVASFSK
jgi:hypothetical protein